MSAIFFDEAQTKWEVQKYLTYSELFELTRELTEKYHRKLIPFAYDLGGWHFVLCMDEGANYGSVIINRWSDYLPNEQFLRIADSFESFIDGLKTEEEIS